MHAEHRMIHRVIRYSVLAFGAAVAVFVVVESYRNPAYLFLQMLFGLWLLSPNLLYFAGTWKLRSRISLLGIGLILCSVQFYFVVKYLTTHHAAAPIILLISPIPEFGVLALGLAIAYLVEYGQTRWHVHPSPLPTVPVPPPPALPDPEKAPRKRRSGQRRGREASRKRVQKKRRSRKPGRQRGRRGGR